MKHTPAPWTIDRFHLCIHGPKGAIAEVFSPDGFEQGYANTVLMAAGPDMLNALKVAHAFLKRLSTDIPDYPGTFAAIEKVYSAILSAGGDQ